MIQIKITGGCGTIILDRPTKCNALSRVMIQELRRALDDLRQEKSVQGIVLTGSGAHFCAGLDAKELHETNSETDATQRWFSDMQSLQSLLQEILLCPKPIVAATDGSVIGTGVALVLACDLIVASHRSTFRVPAPNLGIVSGFVAPLACFRAGAATASRLLIGGDELSASELKELGVVHHLTESDQVWIRASNWVDEIGKGAAEAIQLTKKVLNEMVGENLTSMLANGAAATATSLTTEAAIEGLAAFAEGRTPDFP